MNSSGIKRGLASTAVAALAVTGLPFLASTASATPLTDDMGATDVVLYAPQTVTVSAKNDGTNTSISLLAGGGSDVNAISFQYDNDATAAANWVDVPGGPVARGADGAFGLDWTPAASTVVDQIRAVANVGTPAVQDVTLDNTAATVELSSEGALGVFQSPYTGVGEPAGEYVAVNGTTSDTTVSVEARSQLANITAPGADVTDTVDADSDPATPQTFNSVLDIDGYVYSAGTEANQLVIGANATATDDAEASTLYVQQIANITVTPVAQETSTTGKVTVKVTDQNGKPIANAQIGEFDDQGTASTADDVSTVIDYTNAAGELEITGLAAGSHVFYVNTTDNDVFESGTDKSATATVTTYTPTLSTVTIVNERNRSNYDQDELSNNDDFTIETRDQRGNLIDETLAGDDVQYRWIIDPSGAGDTVTTAWTGAADTTPAGTYTVANPTDADFPGGLPDGSYTLEARRPNVGGTGLTNATPLTVQASESDIAYDEGTEANAPIEGSTTITGALSNKGGGLAGRHITVTYTPGVDSRLAPTAEQPAGVTVTGNTATLTTGADGKFSLKVTDPAGPVVVPDVPEDATFAALADAEASSAAGAPVGASLKGDLGADGDTEAASAPNAAQPNAHQALTIHWAAAPAVAAIEVSVQELDGQAAPGRPVDLDVVVRAEDGVNDGDTSNNPALKDFPVEFSVNKGFLSPNAETVNDLDLADGHDAVGDLWGFFKNDGTSKTVSTGDAAQAGAVAAIEKDSDFDTDGLAEMTITVKAGDKTVTKTVEFDASNVLNLTQGELKRAAGEPSGDVNTGDSVEFNLYTYDQFGNVVGNLDADISDDSAVADFQTDGDFGTTRTDYTVSGAGIRAFSDAPATQTLMARVDGNESLVGANESQASDNNDTLAVSSAPINWVQGTPPKVDAQLVVTGKGAKVDRIKANAISKAAGAKATLWKNGKKVKAGVLNDNGNLVFRIKDRNGNKVTKYVVKIGATTLTFADRGVTRVR
ncbi:hypothetical protein [Nocardioides sp.]|uniref:hypothetical protein n=1 Tax=Nocardioides sp. TaxID=35761 RepID=UPI002EDB4A4A